MRGLAERPALALFIFGLRLTPTFWPKNELALASPGGEVACRASDMTERGERPKSGLAGEESRLRMPSGRSLLVDCGISIRLCMRACFLRVGEERGKQGAKLL